jgi:hypothetical protein
MSVALGRVSLRSSMCASPYRKTGCSIFEQHARRVPLDPAPNIPLEASGTGRVSSPIIQRRTRNASSRQLLTPAEGPGNKSPVSSPAPKSARSLSHGQVVCTYSLDTIRSTTLTRETVTATNDTAGTWGDISLRCKIIIFLLAGRGAVRKVSEVRGSSCHADGAGASSRS